MTDDLTGRLRLGADPDNSNGRLRLRAADEIDRLRAQAPPTAAEVLAHLERYGVVERWSCSSQSWEALLGWSAQLVGLHRADPSTPQPGLRLAPLDQEVTDG